MSRTTAYQIRLSGDEKEAAFAVFRELGISPAQAIRIFLRQVIETRSIPFPIEKSARCPLGWEHTPNAETEQALEDAKSRKDCKTFSNLDDLFADLND
jgi:addiction module RelB/DinJ family antitoxin